MKFDFGTIDYNENKNICKVVLAYPTPLFKELVEMIYSECNRLASYKPYNLITIFEAEVQPTKESYSFYASKERTQYIIKETFVVKSVSIKLAANFYFKVMKPHVKGKAFSNEDEALKWLLSY